MGKAAWPIPIGVANLLRPAASSCPRVSSLLSPRHLILVDKEAYILAFCLFKALEDIAIFLSATDMIQRLASLLTMAPLPITGNSNSAATAVAAAHHSNCGATATVSLFAVCAMLRS